MGLYARHVLPRLIDCGMRYGEATRLRARTIPRARGVVLEVGIGSGLNLPFYTSAVTRLYGVDPSAELLAMARAHEARAAFPVELRQLPADRVSLETATIDTVVTTWTLCSIADPVAALREMRRVLKPGGTLLFVEHGLSPDARVRAWQDRLTPVWRVLAGGCHLNRPIDQVIQAAGFAIAELQTGYIPGPRLLTYMYEGVGAAA